MGKNRNKLHYVKGVCELEKGDVYFEGGMSGVSSLQAWYHVIYAIKDKFKEIDFWIDPKMEKCHTLPSTANYLRYTKCQKFVCEYKPFPKGVVKPKRKLSDLDKKKYAENRAKVDLGVKVELKDSTLDEGGNVVEFVPTEPIFASTEPINEPSVARVPYTVKSNVMMVGGKVMFMASPNENYTYKELEGKLNLYNDCKDILQNIIKDFKELCDEVVTDSVSTDDIGRDMAILETTFISTLNIAKVNCREIDLYTLCKDIGSFGLGYMQYIFDKVDIVVDDVYTATNGSDGFLKLSDMYIKLSNLLVLVTDIFVAIENKARENSITTNEDDEIIF